MSARCFEWTDLEIFLCTARGGSLAAAASALGVDASTVQRRIGKLEAALKARLFERSPRGYCLTPAGDDLLEHVSAMDEQILSARRKVLGRDDALAGTIRVATVDDIAVTILPPIIHSFRQTHPHVTVAVDVRSGLADLARQQADVAVRLGVTAPSGDVIAKAVVKARGGLYASRAYLAKHGTPKRLEDLWQHSIVCGDEAQAGTPIERLISRYADPAKTAFRSESFFARLAAIREGMGIGFLGCFMGDREKQLKRLPFELPELAVDLCLITHVDLRRNARVRAFMEHTHAALRAQRSLFEGQGARSGWRKAR